jgi:hypothetical protein
VPRRKRHQHEYPNSRIQREKEEADFEAFAEAYLRSTGLALEEEGSDTGTQDFTCARSDGLIVGVEFTELRLGYRQKDAYNCSDHAYPVDAQEHQI